MESDISSILNMLWTYCPHISENSDITNEFSLLQSSEVECYPHWVVQEKGEGKGKMICHMSLKKTTKELKIKRCS